MKVTTTKAETLTAQLVRLREDRAGQAETVTAIKAKVTAALTTGGGESTVDALLADQGDAERKLSALDTAIEKVLGDLPAVREAEADEAAQRQVLALAAEREQLMDREVPEAAERRSKAAHALLRELEGEQDKAHRIAMIGAELDALRARFPGLAVPKLKRPFRPPSAENLVQAIQTVYDAHRPLRPLVIPTGASDTPEQIQRATWKALAAWLDRYPGSLSAATRTVLDLAGVPAWETDAQRDRRELVEREKAEEVRRFCGAAAAEAPKAMVRHTL